jgi:hypothetical protein
MVFFLKYSQKNFLLPPFFHEARKRGTKKSPFPRGPDGKWPGLTSIILGRLALRVAFLPPMA